MSIQIHFMFHSPGHSNTWEGVSGMFWCNGGNTYLLTGGVLSPGLALAFVAWAYKLPSFSRWKVQIIWLVLIHSIYIYTYMCIHLYIYICLLIHILHTCGVVSQITQVMSTIMITMITMMVTKMMMTMIAIIVYIRGIYPDRLSLRRIWYPWHLTIIEK